MSDDSQTQPASDRPSWNQRYLDGELPWDTGRPDRHLPEVLDDLDLASGKALEIGCGTGTNVIWLARRGFEASGLDLAEAAIAQAEAKAADAGVDCRWLSADILVDPIPGGPFDFIYDRGCFHVFGEAEQRSRFANRVAALLGPRGIWHSLIGSTDGPPRDSGPPRRSAQDIAAAIEPAFEILELRSADWDLDEHSDKRCWILVARPRADART